MMNKLLSSTYIIPTVLFLFVHLFLISSLDLSDLPGASGTLDLHGAIQGSVQTSQIGWYWKQLHLRGIKWEDAVWSTSLAGVLLAFVGCLIAGNALEGKRGARTIGYLILFWPPIHFFGFVVGVDPLVFGLSWFAVSLFWIAFSIRWWGIVPMLLGGYLLSHALTLKIFAAPMLLYAALSPLCIRRWHPSLWLTIPIWFFSLSIAVPDLGGNGDLRGGLRIPEIDWLPFAAGWYRLSRMMYLGMPEGKFDQILMASFVVVILCRHRWKTRVPMVIISGAILLVSTFILEEHLRTRLIAPAVFGSLVLLAVSISIRRWLRPLGLLILFGFFLELWTFVDLFAERRTQWAGAKEDPFPNAPLLWRFQYIENPILFKDLTLYGAVDARKIIRGSLGEVYSMRLRDGRENSLFSYASLERRESYVLDPKRCCVDVERNCAQVVIERFKGRGGLIVLPTKIDNWERIHDGEKRWWEQLVKELLKQENVQRNDNWIWLEEDLDWGVEPCQKKKKQRR